MKVSVSIKPGSKIPGISIDKGEKYIIRTSARPVDGRANLEMIDILADYFKVPKGKINILSGHKSRNKIVEIDG